MSLPKEDRQPWLVRIRSDDLRICGVGFFLGRNRILTCAHVVNDALDREDRTDMSPPADVVRFDWALLGDEVRGVATVHSSGWFPIEEDGSGDLAILVIRDGIPEGVSPIAWARPRSMWRHAFRTFGYPIGRDHGQFARGELLAPVGAGWFQLEGTNITGAALVEGYSGAPVWDEVARGIVGMIVAVDPAGRDHQKIGYMVPYFILERELSKVDLADRARSKNQGSLLVGHREIIREYRGIAREHERRLIDELCGWLLGQGYTVALTESDDGLEIAVKKYLSRKGRSGGWRFLHRYSIRTSQKEGNLLVKFRVDQHGVVDHGAPIAAGQVASVVTGLGIALIPKLGIVAKIAGIGASLASAGAVRRATRLALSRVEFPDSAAWVLDQYVFSGRFGDSVAIVEHNGAPRIADI